MQSAYRGRQARSDEDHQQHDGPKIAGRERVCVHHFHQRFVLDSNAKSEFEAQRQDQPQCADRPQIHGLVVQRGRHE